MSAPDKSSNDYRMLLQAFNSELAGVRYELEKNLTDIDPLDKEKTENKNINVSRRIFKHIIFIFIYSNFFCEKPNARITGDLAEGMFFRP